MKHATAYALIGLFLMPLTASAAWWNPFSWRKALEHATSTEIVATTTDTSLLPTTQELYQRIAELELKLDRARADLEAAQAQVSAATKVAAKAVASVPAAPVSTGLSAAAERDLQAKAKASLVSIDTPRGSYAGVIIDAQGHILTAARIIATSTDISVTLSSGAKTKASLTGIEEATNIAILQLTDKKASSYLPLTYGSGTSVGDKVYVAGYSSQPNSAAFLPAIISEENSMYIGATTDSKPLDNGGAMLTQKGNLIGIPGASSCKVLEEGRNCLKYSVSANIFPSRVPKLLAGMKLYSSARNETPEEELFRGYLDGFYGNVSQSAAVDAAVSGVTGKNSFDLLNSRLITDTDDKMAKVYILKLKLAAQNMASAYDVLKSLAYALRTSLINDDGSISKLDAYQQNVLRGIQKANDARLTAYQAKVDAWTKKKNEYDGYLTDPSKASNDYLMAEGVALEDGAVALNKERQSVLDSLAGDTINVF